MKSGEKLALRLVLFAFIGVIGFTIYLELDYRKNSVDANAFQAAHETKETSETKEVNITLPIGVIPTGIIPEDLPDAESRGATILTLYCGQCHELPTPVMHSSEEWPPILERMQSYFRDSKKGMLRHVMLPPQKDWQILEVYLSENAQRSLGDPLRYDDIKTEAGQAFISTCSQCHAAPSPESHKKSEWPRVVLRMKSNMRAANIPAPEQATLLKIIDFLQGHSKA
jgi:cytochrome c5